MALNRNQKSIGGTFTQVGDEPMAKQPRSVRLPQSIDEYVASLPPAERSEWLRNAIVTAFQQEQAFSDQVAS